jgi:hypothetical protein
MAIFFRIINLTRREAGIREDRKGCYSLSAFSTRFYFREV